MQMLYDSDSLWWSHMLPDAVEQKGGLNDAPRRQHRNWRAISKLDASARQRGVPGRFWAEMFRNGSWQQRITDPGRVEDARKRYAGLAQNPVVVH